MKHKESIVNTIKNRIYGHGRGWCFTIDHFSDLHNNESVKKSLQLLSQKGIIRRLARGIYDYPKHNAELGLLSPNIYCVAKAISERDCVRIQASGAYAANLMGFSEQVPAKVVFVTEGVAKKVRIGKLEILFQRASPKSMVMAGTEMGLIIQALRHIGSKRVDSKIKKTLKQRLIKVSPKEFEKALKYSPIWIRELFLELRKPT